MQVRLTFLTTSSPSSMNPSLSTAATRTTRWSSPAVDAEPAALEAAQPWEPRFVRRGTVLETVRCNLRKESLATKNVEFQQQRSPQVPLHGAPPDATFGNIKAAATTQSAKREGQERVDGLITSQVLAFSTAVS